MGSAFIATLGQRPEAITVAFDRLNEQHRYDLLAVLHTEPETSGIARAYTELRAVCARDYPSLPIRFHEVTYPDGSPLIDIEDQRSAEAYHRAVLYVLYQYRREGYRLHLMIAGGRKAMSIYAMLAASVIFEPPHDRVWTVLSSESLMAQPGQFHIPAGMRDQVQLVDLPLRPARIAPGTDVEALLARPNSNRKVFFAKLTDAERDLARLLLEHPYATNLELAKAAGKSHRTIDNQLASMYDKMVGFLDFGEDIYNKRQALLDVLRGE